MATIRHKQQQKSTLERHGHCRRGNVSAEYRIWCAMLSRCTNSRAKCYPHYGGRGIRVCERWRQDFAAFYADMGPRPSPKHSIDRIDNDDDYDPGNCRWVTQAQQAQNRRTNCMVTFLGERLCLAALARRASIPSGRLRHRIVVLGWDVERAIATPAKRMGRQGPGLTYLGKTWTLSALARAHRMSVSTLWNRLHRGLDIERAVTMPIDTRRGPKGHPRR